MSWLELRKIIRVGEKSYAVTIPKKWIQSLGLKSGDTVNLILEKNGSICIHPSKEKSKTSIPNKVVVDSSGFNGDILSRTIMGCYVEGYDEVVLVNTKPEFTGVLNALATKLPGIVVLESPSGDITIKIAISENMVDIEEVLTRMIRVLNLMYDYVEDYIEKNDETLAKKVLETDDELDRLYFLGLRLIKRGKGFASLTAPKYQELLDQLLLIRSIEHIGDSLDRSIRILMENDWSKAREYMLKSFAFSRKIISDAITAYINSDIGLTGKLLVRRREFKKMIAEIRTKFQELQGVASELELLSTIAMDISELAVSKYIRNLASSHK
ncbi:phosphate uptake regulator PhoU [Desulfurococcaceae archaeon MEX13E-LK6-19]|nr:phosphate uptake regulator PhoU [Desulfurococcaceae archaeon MEX13E-LK6-19]